MAHLDVDLGFEGDGSGTGTGIGSGPTNSTPVSSVKKQMNKRRKKWQHFTVHENDPNRAICNYCGSNLGCKSSSAGNSIPSGGTSCRYDRMIQFSTYCHLVLVKNIGT
jgi:hypothetical protein